MGIDRLELEIEFCTVSAQTELRIQKKNWVGERRKKSLKPQMSCKYMQLELRNTKFVSCWIFCSVTQTAITVLHLWGLFGFRLLQNII